MIFKDYLDKINKLAKENPNLLNAEVIYSIDDEGNEYRYVSCEPTTTHYIEDDLDVKDVSEYYKANAILIN